MVDDSQKRFEKRQAAARKNIEKQKEKVKNETRREVKQQDNSLTTEPTVTKPVTAKPVTREQRKNQQKIINRIQQINELLSEFQPESIKNTLIEERKSLIKGDFSKTSNYYLKQYGGANYTYPQFTDQELEFDKLVNVQPEIFAPQFTDKKLDIDQLVDVQAVKPKTLINDSPSTNSDSSRISAPQSKEQKLINRISQIQKQLSVWQPDWQKETLQTELKSLSKGDWKETPSMYKQYGGANYTYPQLPIAQTLGQFNMSTPYANKNTDVLPDDSQIPIMKPKSSKEVWETTEPEIRESWGLEPKTEPELQYDPYAVKYKNRDMYNVDFEKGVNKFNTRANMLLAATGERGDAQRETQLFNDLTADNIFASTNRQKRGTFDPLSGILEPDKMGFRGVAQYGGFMQNGGDVYDEDDETWMSEDQIRQFLAEGGELEFI